MKTKSKMAVVNTMVLLMLISSATAQAPTLEQLQQIFELLVAQNGGGSRPAGVTSQGSPLSPNVIQPPFPVVGGIGSADSQSQPPLPQDSSLPSPEISDPTPDLQGSSPGILNGALSPVPSAPQPFDPSAPQPFEPIAPQPFDPNPLQSSSSNQPSDSQSGNPVVQASGLGTQFLDSAGTVQETGAAAQFPGSTVQQFGPFEQGQGTGHPTFPPGFGQQNRPVRPSQPGQLGSAGQLPTPGNPSPKPNGFQGIAIQFPE